MDILRSTAQPVFALEKSLLATTLGAVGAGASILEYPTTSVNRASGGAIAFVDGGLTDYQQMVDAMAGSEIEVIVLDAGGDAIAQMTQSIVGRQNIQSIHILSHGTQGGLKLGESWLDLQTLPSYVSQIQTWGQSLSQDADILLYGCNVAQNAAGRGFISLLSQLTGADVAASNDITGAQSNWQLEVATGAIESAQLAFEQYQYNLATYMVTASNDTGVGSLRNAIQLANSNAGKDIIEFDTTAFTTPKTITLASQLLIKDSVEIKGLGANLITISGDKNQNSTNDSGDTRIFFIQSGDISISNLTLANGRAQGRDGGTGGAGAGLGGAIYVDGYDELGNAKNTSLTIDNVVFNNNVAIGGSTAAGNSVPGGVGFSEFDGKGGKGGLGGASVGNAQSASIQGQAGSAGTAPNSTGGAAGSGTTAQAGQAGTNGGGGSGGGGQGPWGRGPSSGGQGGPPDLEEMLRRGQDRIKQFIPGGFGNSRTAAGIAAAIVAIWLVTGTYQVQPNELGVPLIFGRVQPITTAGLHWNWPAPIGKVLKPSVTAINTVEVGIGKARTAAIFRRPTKEFEEGIARGKEAVEIARSLDHPYTFVHADFGRRPRPPPPRRPRRGPSAARRGQGRTSVPRHRARRATVDKVRAAIDDDAVRLVIYMGGDGTFAEVAKGILSSAHAAEVDMGMLPTGTA
ncbi:MAG: DUF4347 domain-containing protein, partial [Alkalinema sp. RU_4_3]|nr:DUF4347 domain-containing protein [Alkalinema sp. RU_4_3]